MKLYRITKQCYLENYSGLGASFQSGARWNQKGHPVLYFATTPSVALLEMANYLPSPRFIPKDYRLGIYKLAEHVAIKTVTIAELPQHWADYPYPTATQQIGTTWLTQQTSLALSVPSAAVPGGLENIVLLNCKLICQDKPQITLIDATADLYNKRMFTALK